MAGRGQGRARTRATATAGVVAPNDGLWYENTIETIVLPSTPVNAFDSFCSNLGKSDYVKQSDKILPIKNTMFDMVKSSEYNKIQDFLVGGPKMVSNELKLLQQKKQEEIEEMRKKEYAVTKAAEEANKKLIEQRLTPMQNRRRRLN